MKVIRKAANNPDHPTADHDINKELDAMQRVADAHCVKLIEVFETPEEVQMVLEHMHGGDLFQRILTGNKDKPAGIPEEEVKKMIREIILGVKALHSNHIIHRDLKPENILLGEHGTCKIADLGLAHLFPHERSATEAGSTTGGEAGTQTTATLQRTGSQVGTPGYAAPEVLEGVPYSYAVDIWSLGVVTYCALSGCTPFPTDMSPETVEKVRTGSYSFPLKFGWGRRSEASMDFVRSMLQVNPDDRPSLDALLAHPWLQEESTKREPGLGAHAVPVSDQMVEASANLKKQAAGRPPARPRHSTGRRRALGHIRSSR